jgi:EAL domain-containing protein (putative c-di-GMP-specific phosphodiesterase class I)
MRNCRDGGILAAPVALKVSAVQFRQASFRGLFEQVSQETGLADQTLEMELTENLLLPNGTLEALRDSRLTDVTALASI